MGIAEKVYEVVKNLPDPQAAENVKGRSASVRLAQRRVDLTLFRRYRAAYDGSEIARDEINDRAGLR